MAVVLKHFNCFMLMLSLSEFLLAASLYRTTSLIFLSPHDNFKPGRDTFSILHLSFSIPRRAIPATATTALIFLNLIPVPYQRPRHCERSEAIQGVMPFLDCFATTRLAMTIPSFSILYLPFSIPHGGIPIHDLSFCGEYGEGGDEEQRD
ncbi:MAG: hypothetical protein LBT00_16065 [Spirochaetaceae bacterium]|nr:hypothetical protein [Spirochaetaceae bacterium]